MLAHHLLEILNRLKRDRVFRFAKFDKCTGIRAHFRQDHFDQGPGVRRRLDRRALLAA